MEFVDMLKFEINQGKIEKFYLTQKIKHNFLINIFNINKMKETVKNIFRKCYVQKRLCKTNLNFIKEQSVGLFILDLSTFQ